MQSFAIACYAIGGLYVGTVVVPVRSTTFVAKGAAAICLAAALLVAAANMLAVVLDHYDQRDNEHLYERFARGTRALGWILVALATVFYVPGL